MNFKTIKTTLVVSGLALLLAGCGCGSVSWDPGAGLGAGGWRPDHAPGSCAEVEPFVDTPNPLYPPLTKEQRQAYRKLISSKVDEFDKLGKANIKLSGTYWASISDDNIISTTHKTEFRNDGFMYSHVFREKEKDWSTYSLREKYRIRENVVRIFSRNEELTEGDTFLKLENDKLTGSTTYRSGDGITTYTNSWARVD